MKYDNQPTRHSSGDEENFRSRQVHDHTRKCPAHLVAEGLEGELQLERGIKVGSRLVMVAGIGSRVIVRKAEKLALVSLIDALLSLRTKQYLRPSKAVDRGSIHGS